MTLTCCNPQDSYKYGIYENESAGETYGGAIKCGKITKKNCFVCVCVWKVTRAVPKVMSNNFL